VRARNLKEEIALKKVREWLQRYGWTIIPNPKTYRGYDILAKDKEGNLKKIEVKYRSLPNFQKGTFDLSDTELKTCDFCFLVIFGPKPDHEYRGMLMVVPSQHRVTSVLKHRVHLSYIH